MDEWAKWEINNTCIAIILPGFTDNVDTDQAIVGCIHHKYQQAMATDFVE